MGSDERRNASPAGREEDPIPLRRIKIKLEVLTDWRTHGIPRDKLSTVPRSLAQARTWEDKDLGVRGKGSYRDFTITHPVYGIHVKKIADEIVKLRRMADEWTVVQMAERLPAGGKAAEDGDDALIAAVSQWHSERQRADDLAEQCRDAEHRRRMAEQDVARLDNEIRGLRLRLSAASPTRLASVGGLPGSRPGPGDGGTGAPAGRGGDGSNARKGTSR